MAHFKELDNFVHVLYLAVNKNFQSKGYGSKMLTFIKQKFFNKPLALDVEEKDDNASNSEKRKRRIKFYKANGFTEGKYQYMWAGELMTYMSTYSIDADEFMKHMQKVYPTISNIVEKQI